MEVYTEGYTSMDDIGYDDGFWVCDGGCDMGITIKKKNNNM
jgi:hypothetical protein